MHVLFNFWILIWLFRLDYSHKRESSLMQCMYADHKSLLNFFLFLHSIKLNCLFRAGFRLHKKLLHSYIYILLIAIVQFLRKKGPHTACSRSVVMDHFHSRVLSSCKCAAAAGHFICFKIHFSLSLEFRIVISFSDFN